VNREPSVALGEAMPVTVSMAISAEEVDGDSLMISVEISWSVVLIVVLLPTGVGRD
jgi:hypothetical protein